jgi:hypothetical protein
MPTSRSRPGRGRSPASVATQVRERVLAGGERFWTFADFRDLSGGAVAHALSRLAAEGELRRERKGLYYRPKSTVLGSSVPSFAGAVAASVRAPMHPAGLTAANLLGLTTQNPSRPEYATTAGSVPTLLADRAAVRTRRPVTRGNLTPQDGALLELLRERARSSDLSPEETVERLLAFVRDPADFARLSVAALAEPPRVRAMLGALGQQAGADPESLERLRESLNPLSRFDFGVLRELEHAREWQGR